MTKSKRWLAALLWAVVIFAFSADSHSGERSHDVLQFFLGDSVVAESQVVVAQLVIRKLAHMTEYAVLCGLICWAWGKRSICPKVRLGLLALVTTFAVTDELHQCYVPGRAGCVEDVLIDSCGAAMAVVGLGFVLRAIEKRGVTRPSV